ncbi:hypothetical protein, partial [Nocardioides sp. GCM10030258]
MDLGTQPSLTGSHGARTTAEILTDLRAKVRTRQELVVGEWIDVVDWATDNVVTTTEGAATIMDGVIDTGVPIAG